MKRLIVTSWPDAAATLGPSPEFQLRILGAEEGWGSFVTETYWRSMPGPWIAALTFLVCGFLTVYVLGSRSFCACRFFRFRWAWLLCCS